MSIRLQHGHTVHRAEEYRREHHPVVEGRSVQVRRHEDHRAKSGSELNEFLHGASVAQPPSAQLVSLASVGSLSLPIGPAAIPGAIGPVIVDPVERMARRRIAHVSSEIGVIVPTGTNTDAAAAVVLPCPMIGIAAPLPHAAPDPIEASLRQTVSFVSSGQDITHKATTRCGVSRAELSDGDFCRVAATTEAAPTDASASAACAFFKDGEPPKLEARNINFLHLMIVSGSPGGCNV